MNDDLRNMVWKGHYLGAQPSDVMMHVPVDEHLARANDKVRIFGPITAKPRGAGSAATRGGCRRFGGSGAGSLHPRKIGVETASLADSSADGAQWPAARQRRAFQDRRQKRRVP